MKKKRTSRFELRLSLTHLVLAFGIVMGSMLCAFYVGLSSGRSSGFEMASQDALVKSVRLPIVEEYDAEAGREDERVSRVYAKLQETLPRGTEDEAPSELPELSAQKTVAEGLTAKVEKQTDAVTEKVAKSIESASSGSIRLEQPISEATKRQEKEVTSLGDAVRVLGEDRPREVVAPKVPVQELPKSEAKKEVLVAKNMELTEPKQKTLGGLLELNDVESPKKVVKKTPKVEQVLPPKKKVSIDPPALKKPLPKRVERAEVPQPIKPKVAFRGDTGTVSRTQPKKTAPVKKPTIPVTTKISKGWYAQVAAKQNKTDALNLAGKLRKSGFPVVLEEAVVRGTRYYRVLTGPESSRVYGERLLSQLKREKFLTSDPFLRPVK